jgi:hypothetical protein
VVFGQNVKKTMKMHYPWGNLRRTLGKNHEILLGFGQNVEKTIKMHFPWGNLGSTLGKNHEILRGIWSK